MKFFGKCLKNRLMSGFNLTFMKYQLFIAIFVIIVITIIAGNASDENLKFNNCNDRQRFFNYELKSLKSILIF